MRRDRRAGRSTIVARDKDRRIGIVTQPDVVGPVAKVCGGNQPVCAELLIDREIPLLDVAGTQVGRQIDVHAALREERVACRRESQREGRHRLVLIWIGQSPNRPRQGDTAAEWAVVSKPVEVELLRVVVEQAVAGANCLLSFATRVPVEADARREVGPVALHVRARCLWVAAEEQSRRRIGKNLAYGPGCESSGIKMTAAVVTVRGGEIGLPANAEIQGKIGPETIAILRINAVVTLAPVLLFIISLGK